MKILKVAILLVLSSLWISLLCVFLPDYAVMGAYLIMAIYYRFMYFRDSQMIQTLYPEVMY